MDLDELKMTWQHYDDELKKFSILNERALHRMMENRPGRFSVNSKLNEYFGILFSCVLALVFVYMIIQVDNNPPMIVSFSIVLLAIALGMGMSIYKLRYSSLPDFGNNSVMITTESVHQIHLTARRERIFSIIFSPALIVSLFILLFFGMTIKTL